MLQSNKTLTASQIRSLDITFDTWLAFDFENDTYFLLADRKRIASFESRKAQLATYNKARKMLFGYGGNSISEGPNEEERGIIEAINNGENPFSGTTITDGKSI
jgi:hypothetical protein